MNTYAKLAFATVAVAAVALIGFNLLRGSAPLGPTASPSATPSATAEASASLPVLPNAGRPDPGTYTLGVTFPTFVRIDVPEDWEACGSGSVERGVCPTQPGGGVGIWSIANVVADPCPEGQLLEPAVGPSVDDLVAALSELEGFTASQPSAITVDGFRGQQFTLTAPPDAAVACDDPQADGFRTWQASTRINGVGAGEVNEIRVLDVGGERVMLTVAYHPDAVTEQQIDALRQVAESIHFVP